MNIFNKIINFYQIKKINNVFKAISYIDQKIEPGRRLRHHFKQRKGSLTFDMIDGWTLEFNNEFIHQIKTLDPFDINTFDNHKYDYFYYYRLFLTLYIFIKENNHATVTFNKILFSINTEFNKGMLDIFMKNQKSSEYIMLLVNVKDSNGEFFLDFFMKMSIDRWVSQKNPDYLLIYIKYYFTYDDHQSENRDLFKDINPFFKEYILDILCLINDYYPNFIGLVEPINH